MRRSLAVLCLLFAASTGCSSSGTPTPEATPSGGTSERPPVGYVLTDGF